MSLIHPLEHSAAHHLVSLEGIGPEAAITIQRALEGQAAPDHVIEAGRMVLRSEIRGAMPTGDRVSAALKPDEAEIMKDVAARVVLGEAETTYADELAYTQVHPESPEVSRTVARYMARSLKLMQLASKSPDQDSAANALQALQDVQAIRHAPNASVVRARHAGAQLVAPLVHRAS